MRPNRAPIERAGDRVDPRWKALLRHLGQPPWCVPPLVAGCSASPKTRAAGAAPAAQDRLALDAGQPSRRIASYMIPTMAPAADAAETAPARRTKDHSAAHSIRAIRQLPQLAVRRALHVGALVGSPSTLPGICSADISAALDRRIGQHHPASGYYGS